MFYPILYPKISHYKFVIIFTILVSSFVGGKYLEEKDWFLLQVVIFDRGLSRK
jgi:hypothetical protein